MQKREIINKKELVKLIQLIYSMGATNIFESYSQMGQKIQTFESPEELCLHIEKVGVHPNNRLSFGITFQECEGIHFTEKIKVDAGSSDRPTSRSSTFLYSKSGWGVINIELVFTNLDTEIDCLLIVNSHKRALNWESLKPELGAVDAWNWNMVKSKMRKLIRELKRIKPSIDVAQ